MAVPRETAALSVTERIAQVCQSAQASINNLENPSVDPPATIHMHLLIGPEGGLSASEEQLALDNDFIAWQIGARILRTETAPVVALATLHALTTPDLAESQ